MPRAYSGKLKREALVQCLATTEDGFKFAILEFSDELKVLESPCALDQAISGHGTGVLLAGRVFGEHVELSWRAAEEDEFRVVYVAEGDTKPPCNLGSPTDLDEGHPDTVYLWGRPAEGKGPDDQIWYEPRVHRVNLPLQWTEQTDIPMAEIVTYKRPDAMPIWRFKDLKLGKTKIDPEKRGAEDGEA